MKSYVSRLLMAVTFGMSACAHQHPMPQAVSLLDASAIAARVRSAKSNATELTADAQVTYFGSRGRYRLQASLMLARPDRFRANLLGPQGGALYAVGCDGLELTFLDMAANRGTRTTLEETSLGALLGVPALGMTPEGLVSLILGEAPLLPESVCEKSWDPERAQIKLFCREPIAGTGTPPSDASSTQVWIDPDTWQVTEAHFYHKDLGTLTGRFRERGPGRVATRTELTWEAQARPAERLEFELRDVDVKPPIGPDSFALAVPPSIHLDEK